MPNPFPGMDPYLEGDLWMSVHTDLCAEIARQVAPKVRPKYFVPTIRRLVRTALPEPIPHVSVEIHDVLKRRLVTCIEVLSPTNKVGPGREEYAGKRLQILSSSAHLVEIDLLRAGVRFPTGKPLPSAPYFVFVSRAEDRKNVQVWPIALDFPLPEVPIPLLPDDPDATLDLGQALTTIYNILGYDDMIDYTQPPPGPISDATLSWLRARLRQERRIQSGRTA